MPLVLHPGYQIGTLAGSGVSVFEFVASWRRDGKAFVPKEVAGEEVKKSEERRGAATEAKVTGVEAVSEV